MIVSLAEELCWVRILHQLMHMQIDTRRAQQHPIGPATEQSHEVPQIPAA